MAQASDMVNSSYTNRGNSRGVGFLLAGAALFAFIQSFALIAPILLSFFLVLLISLALDPLVRRVARWTGGRTTATALLATLLLLVLGLTAWAFFGPLTSSVSKLSDQLPKYWEKLQKPLIKMEQQAVRSEQKLQAEVKTEIAHTAPKAPASAEPAATLRRPVDAALASEARPPTSLRSGFAQLFQNLAGGFAGAAFNAAQVLVVIATVFFGVLFTLLQPVPVFGALYAMVPEEHHERIRVIARRIGSFLPAWAGATALGMLTIGTLVFLLMWPIFGVMDALLLGLIAGVFEAFPYIGPILSAVPALVFGLIKGGTTPMWVLAAYVAVQALENNVILPYIMAREMELHPVAVIFSMLLCALAFGVLGVVLAAPVVAIAMILHDELYRKRFLPTVSQADVDRMVRRDIGENRIASLKH